MSAVDSTSESQNRALHDHRGRARSIVPGVAVSLLAVFGGLVLIGMTAFTLQLDVFGRIAADQILANAIRPSGREMPTTSDAIPYASADIQIVGGMGLGINCSLPPMLEGLAFPTRNEASPIGLRMRQACSYHNYCYRHGAATYGYTQADCDFALQVQAFRLCSFIERAAKRVSNSTYFQPYKNYTIIPGNPSYLTSAPVVVRAGFGGSTAVWVWWQRASEDNTTGRLLALAPALATDAERSCFALPTGCAGSSPHIVSTEIGKAKGLADDAQIGQLQPADLGPAAIRGISLVTLRNHRCFSVGNAPCYMHVLVRTDGAIGEPQPQEPLSVDDRFSRKPVSVDNDRYRNLASLPFVLDSRGTKAPVIAWTRRDGATFRSNAHLRRAAVDPGEMPATDDDTAVSHGTAFLPDFSESDEPAFVLGRSSSSPMLVNLRDTTATIGSSAASMREWRLPPPDIGDRAPKTPIADLIEARCQPGLGAEWLQRPPQIVRRPDGSSLAVFTRLQPSVSNDWTMAKLRLSTLVINPDGSCPSSAWQGAEIPITTPKPSKLDEAIDPVERGRIAVVRISRGQIPIADLNADGLTDVTLPQGSGPDAPLRICSLTTGGTCIAFDRSDGG